MAGAPRDSRSRIFAAAAQEFAAHGFAGANVDRLARRARVNKAMIYYHFRSKAALYREILRHMFAETSARVQAVAQGPDTPARKLDAFIEAIAQAAQARPHFPAIWLRELAEGGQHLDPDTFHWLGTIPAALAEILRAGRDAGEFNDTDPLLAHFTIAGPIIVHFASLPIRKRFRNGMPALMRETDVATVIAHVQRTARAMVTAGAPAPAGRSRGRPPRVRASVKEKDEHGPNEQATTGPLSPLPHDRPRGRVRRLSG